jgi:ArsR family transcriptional regulator
MTHERKSDFEQRLYEMQAAMCKTTSNPVRLSILRLIGDQELSVSVIAVRLGQPIPTVSKHLNMMKSHGVVRSRREGNVVFYSVTDRRILKAISLLSDVLMDRLQVPLLA